MKTSPKRLEDLQRSIEKHLGLRLQAYGTPLSQPKVHYSLHLPLILKRDNQLVSCWVHERKHKTLKRYGNQSTNANKYLSWEKGILEDVILQQALDLSTWDPRTGVVLENRKAASPEMTEAIKRSFGLLDPSVTMWLASEASVNLESFGRGDAVLSSTGVMEVWFHVQIESDILGTSFYSVVSKWKRVGPNRFQVKDVPEFIETDKLERAMPFYLDGDVAVVIP